MHLMSLTLFLGLVTLLTACNGFRANIGPIPGRTQGDGSIPVRCGSVTISWDNPTENVDNSPLTDLAGNKIYYGVASRTYSGQIAYNDLTKPTYQITGLTPAHIYYITVTAVNSAGLESAFGNEIPVDFKVCEDILIDIASGTLIRTGKTEIYFY